MPESMPKRLVITFVGCWLDGRTVDTSAPETLKAIPLPERMMIDPATLWSGCDGLQLGKGFIGVSPEGLRQVERSSDETEVRKRMQEGFRHQYKVTDRHEDGDEVRVTMTHGFLPAS